MFTMSTIISAIINIALFAGIFFLPLYLQNIVGLSAMRTGLLMMPAALATAVMMPISGRLFDRFGARPLGIVGLLVITIVTIGFTRLDPNTSVGYVQWLYVLRSLGMGLTMMPVMTAGMNTLPPQLMSQGSGLSNTARQVSSSLGTAVLTTIMTQREQFHFGVMAQNVTPFTYQGQFLSQLQQALQSQGLTAAAAQTTAATDYAGLLQERAFVMGLNDAFWVATVLTAIALVLVLFYASKREAEIRRGNRQKKGAKAARPAMEA
jgi:predicted MFS family arabinose efflux permease